MDALENLRAFRSPFAVDALAETADAALALGDLEKVEELLRECAALEPAERTLSLEAQEARIAGRLAARREAPERAEQRFRAACARFRELGRPFWLGVTLLELGEWLLHQGRAGEGEPLLAEARGLFERLGARPWLERVARAQAAGLEAEAVA